MTHANGDWNFFRCRFSIRYAMFQRKSCGINKFDRIESNFGICTLLNFMPNFGDSCEPKLYIINTIIWSAHSFSLRFFCTQINIRHSFSFGYLYSVHTRLKNSSFFLYVNKIKLPIKFTVLFFTLIPLNFFVCCKNTCFFTLSLSLNTNCINLKFQCKFLCPFRFYYINNVTQGLENRPELEWQLNCTWLERINLTYINK